MPQVEYLSDGPTQAAIMVFIHGWPDTPALWEHQVEEFSKDHHCIRIALPNFQSTSGNKVYTFDQIVTGIINTIEKVLAESPEESVTLVGHDWGAFLSYLIEERRSDLVSKLVTLDVGAVLKPETLLQSLFIVTYQWSLVLSFLSGLILPPLGQMMTVGIAKVLGVPKTSRAKWRMNYLYYHYWSLMIKGKVPRTKSLPQSKLLYIYGTKKPVMFHTKRWLEKVRSIEKNRVVGLPGEGHWFVNQASAVTNRAIRDF